MTPNADRGALIADVTDEVAQAMSSQGCAYFSAYNNVWQVRAHPQVSGIVAATLRALERRGVAHIDSSGAP